MSATIRILIANSPKTYRQAHVSILRAMRPDVEVILAEPGELDREINRLAPHLVLCSELTERVRSAPFAWVLLYPGGANLAVASIGGKERTIQFVGLEDVLTVVDETRRCLVANTARIDGGFEPGASDLLMWT